MGWLSAGASLSTAESPSSTGSMPLDFPHATRTATATNTSVHCQSKRTRLGANVRAEIDDPRCFMPYIVLRASKNIVRPLHGRGTMEMLASKKGTPGGLRRLSPSRDRDRLVRHIAEIPRISDALAAASGAINTAPGGARANNRLYPPGTTTIWRDHES